MFDWTAFGVLLSAVGLACVAFSLWQVNRSFKAQMIGRLYGELHHVHQTFIDHPGLRPVFFHNGELSSEDPEYMRARGMAEMFLDIFEHIFILRPFAPRHLRDPLTGYIRHMCVSSRFLRRYLLENEALLHPKELLLIVRSSEKSQANVGGVSS